MSQGWRGRRYEVGTLVQHRNGYIVRKIVDDEGKEKMVAESRRMWELKRGPLEEGDKVFHMDGDRTNNDIRNLSKIHFNQTKFVFLEKSKVLWIPSIRTIDKKTRKVLLNS